MNIHPDQQNIRQLAETADFVDSGYQSFVEQVRHLKAKMLAEAAFYAGAGLAMKLCEHFEYAAERYGDGAPDYLRGLITEEINAYMERNGMTLEWEPHVPTRWKQ